MAYLPSDRVLAFLNTIDPTKSTQWMETLTEECYPTYPDEDGDPLGSVFKGGKYQGRTHVEVASLDPDYFRWCLINWGMSPEERLAGLSYLLRRETFARGIMEYLTQKMDDTKEFPALTQSSITKLAQKIEAAADAILKKRKAEYAASLAPQRKTKFRKF